MALNFYNIKPVFRKFQDDLITQAIGFVRNASKKSGGSRPRKQNSQRRPRYGFKVPTDSDVRQGLNLYQQRVLHLAPGLNTGITGRGMLYAKIPGKLVVSCEKTNFNPDDHHVQKSFPHYPAVYKEYLNVIPKPQHRRFKLIETF